MATLKESYGVLLRNTLPLLLDPSESFADIWRIVCSFKRFWFNLNFYLRLVIGDVLLVKWLEVVFWFFGGGVIPLFRQGFILVQAETELNWNNSPIPTSQVLRLWALTNHSSSQLLKSCFHSRGKIFPSFFFFLKGFCSCCFGFVFLRGSP